MMDLHGVDAKLSKTSSLKPGDGGGGGGGGGDGDGGVW